MGQDERKKQGASPISPAVQKELKGKEPANQELTQERTQERTQMSFGDAIRILTTGDYRARRIAWALEDYITMRGGYLHVFTKGVMHTLTVGDGDIINDDWVII